MDNNDFMEYSPFSNGFSMLNTYAEDLSKKEYVTNPAIAREEEIKKLILFGIHTAILSWLATNKPDSICTSKESLG